MIGIVYYSDCRGDARILQAVRDQIVRIAYRRLPVLFDEAVAVTLEPLADHRWEHNIVLPLERGPLTMFKQILAGLEALESDVAFLVEHDVLYAPEHFSFTPPRDDTFYYNQNRWQVRSTDGFAVHYKASQTSGCCASRQLLIAHYRKRIAHVEAHGFDRNLGYEPGTNRRARELDPHGADVWFASVPNIDIRHGQNLSKSKWSIADFRNKANAVDWTESDRVPGWGVTKDRFWEFLEDLKVAQVAA